MSSILIVEDDVLANEYLEFILEQAGYEVVSATSADEASVLLEGRGDHERSETRGHCESPKARNEYHHRDGLRYASGRRDPARELIRSKTIQCAKNDRGSTAFPVATPPLRWTDRADDDRQRHRTPARRRRLPRPQCAGRLVIVIQVL
jgi:CheY-like chemotaxis protein